MILNEFFNNQQFENTSFGNPEPEQQQMDADRRGRLGRERNAGLDEPDDAASEPAQTRNGVYEYTVPAGQESIAQELGLQQHRGHWVSRIPIQRANFQFGRPQFHEIPSQGVAEGKDNLESLQAKAKQISDKIDSIVQSGGRVGLDDPLSRQLKAIRNKIKQAKQGVAEGQTPEQEIERLKLRQNAEHGGASLKRQAETQARIRELEKQIKDKKGVAEGMLDNPGEQDSPAAQAIIRRILLQRTDLLAKYGPEKVGQAVDEVADFVGDVDEIGSSDVSGWIRHVEQMLGNMDQGVAESSEQIDELSPGTLKSYANKARAQVRASPGANPNNSHLPTDPKIANRARGAVKADNRLHGFGPVKKSTQGVAEGSPVDSNGYSVDQEDAGEYDYEGDQAKDQLQTIMAAARKLDSILDDNENLPEWVQMKITKATDYLDTAADYIAANKAQSEPMAETKPEKIGGVYDPVDFDAKLDRMKARHQQSPSDFAALAARLQAAYKKPEANKKPTGSSSTNESRLTKRALMQKILKG